MKVEWVLGLATKFALMVGMLFVIAAEVNASPKDSGRSLELKSIWLWTHTIIFI